MKENDFGSMTLKVLNEQITDFKKLVEKAGFKIKCNHNTASICTLLANGEPISSSGSEFILDSNDTIEVVK